MTMPKTLSTIEDLDLLLTITPEESLTIDLRDISAITPPGIVGLLGIMERFTNVDHVPSMTINLPVDQTISEYLRTAGAFDAMREFAVIQDPQPEELIAEKVPATPMIPCAHFTGDGEVEELANQLSEKFKTEFVAYGSLLAPVETIFTELATNVTNHADSGGGYVVAQQYRGRSQTLLEIAIADSGIGIRESLIKNPQNTLIEDDSKAIRMALQEGISATGQKGRGYGLHHVTEDIKTNETRKMTIRSGTGILILEGNGEVKEYKRVPPFPGTIVHIIIPCEDHP